MKSYSEIPKDPWYRSWKHSLEFLADAPAFFDKQIARHGNIFRCQLFGMDYVRTQDADITALIFKNSNDLVSTAKGWGPVFDGLFPNGLLMKDGMSHITHRRIMQHAFNKKAMLSYFDHVKQWSDEMAQDLLNKQEVDFFPYIKGKTLDLALSMFLGLDAKDQQGKDVSKAFVDMVSATLALVRKPILNNKFHRGVKGRAYLKSIFSDLVVKRRAHPGNDLISFMCEAKDEEGNALSDEMIVDHIIFTMMAAHDTTASSVTSLLIILSQNKKWMQVVKEEAKNNPEISYETLSQMSKTENVFKETMRIMPAIVTAPRVINNETQMLGFNIPAGSRTGISIYGNHHDSRYWTNPNEFDPTRFERGEDKNHPFSYIPFGGGVHKCIGLHLAMMQAKLVMQSVFSELDVDLVDPEQKIKYAKVPIWQPKGSVMIKFTHKK